MENKTNDSSNFFEMFRRKHVPKFKSVGEMFKRWKEIYQYKKPKKESQ